MTSTTPFAGLSSGSAAAHALDLPGSTQFPAMLALLLVLLALPFLALSCAVQVPFSTDGEPNLKSSKPATALKLLKLKQAPDLEQFPGRHGPQLRRLSPLHFFFPPPPPRPLLPLSSENIGHAFEVYQELGVLARGVRVGLCKGGEFLFRRGSRFLSFAHLPTQLVRQVLASFLASSSSLQGEVFRAVSRLDVRDPWRRRVRQWAAALAFPALLFTTSKAQSLPFKVLQSSNLERISFRHPFRSCHRYAEPLSQLKATHKFPLGHLGPYHA